MDTGSQGHNQNEPTIELDRLFRNIYFGLSSDGLFPSQARFVYSVEPPMDLLQVFVSYEFLPGIMEPHYQAAWVALRLRLAWETRMIPMYTVQSRGRQYPPVVRAYYILGRRAMAKGEVTAAYAHAAVATLVASYLGDRPVPLESTAWRWQKDEPDLPECLARAGQFGLEDLPRWLRHHLHQDGGDRAYTQGVIHEYVPDTPAAVPVGYGFSMRSPVESLAEMIRGLTPAFAALTALCFVSRVLQPVSRGR